MTENVSVSSSERIHSIDTLRGAGVIGLVFLHSVVYYYAKIDTVDFENPPIFIAIIGLMVLWGGLFAIVSGCVNTFRYARRQMEGHKEWPHRRRLVLTGVALLVVHFIYNAVAAPTSFDFDTGNHSSGLIANLLRNGSVTVASLRLVEGTALLMLSLNLIVLAISLPLLSRSRHPVRNSTMLVVLFMASGLLRFVFLPLYESQVVAGRYALALLLSPLAAKPYPILPYLAFGFAGSAFGFSLARPASRLRLGWIPGLVSLLLGIAGVLFLPTNLVGADLFWYSKVYLELGVFVLVTWTLLKIAGPGRGSLHIVQRFGRISLTVFLCQIPLSELLAAALTRLLPGWNDTIPRVIIFGLFNVTVWIGIVAVWSRFPRATVEGLWARIFRGSTKLDGLSGR